MTLAPGTHLGRYEIRAALGAGGMGEVYLAHDPQLNRQVAIKVLPAALASNQDRLGRFVQEARAASALNHPNILTVHEIGEAGPTSFIVTEFVDGVTLRTRLAGRRLKLREVLDIAAQIADALSRAHQAGIVHRDIKPDNVMIRADGIVKVLDFGLAKLVERAAPSADASTRVAVNTTPGVVMGTSRYMSPEQARGLDLDARSDIFSLGIVIYQMATGQLAFDGATTSDVIAAILDREPPPPSHVSADLPHDLDRIVAKALAKDPEERYQVVKDLLLDLKALRRELDTEQTAAHQPARSRRRTALVGGVGAAVAAALIVAWILLPGRRAAALTDRDTIVVADFLNTTGDPVFDGTLRQGLAVQLGQSPYLNIYSDDRVREALRFMGRPPDERVSREVAREICQRQGLKAFLAGSIAGLGSHYALTIEAINAQTGDTIAREQVEADGKEQVLTKLGSAAMTLREELGESLASIQKFATPIESATTSSLGAFKAYVLGDEHRGVGRYAEAIPLYKRATELDPNFALAYARLAVMYSNLRQPDQGASYSAKAFELRDRVSERERFYIDARYYGDVLADVDKTIEVYELWRQTYPRDYVAHNNLAVILTQSGQFGRALQSAQEALRLNPNAASPYTNVGAAQLGLERLDEARAVLEQAIARKLDSLTVHMNLYNVAVIRGDVALQEQQLEWAKGRSDESVFVSQQSGTLFTLGRLGEGRALLKRVVEMTSASNPEAAAFATAGTALAAALFEDCATVKETTTKALAIRRTKMALGSAGLALAFCGETSTAQVLTDELAKTSPSDTFVHAMWLPLIRSANALYRGNPGEAIQLSEPTRRFGIGAAGYWATYVRGLAYLRQRAGSEAAAEFRRLLDNRGSSFLAFVSSSQALYALGELGLARAAALTGDVAASRKAYQDLFVLWKDADPDLALLRQAKDEYAKLK